MNRLYYLLERKAGHIATEAQLAELLELLQQPGAEEAFAGFKLQQRLFFQPIQADLADEFEKIRRELHKKEVTVPVRSHKWQYAITAALVLLLAGTSYLFFHNNKPTPAVAATQEQRFKNDVAPGSNKAMLTLADGSQVALDDAANGILAHQGNTQITKLKGGELSYKSAIRDPRSAISYNTLSTPRGGQYQVQLPDGSRVWLNAASSLRYPTAFTGKERMVELKGEGFFEIAENAAQPFKVAAGNMTVNVLGTSFNMNAYSDEPMTNTTLLDGKVQVTNGEVAMHLTPGQQAVLDGAKLELIKKAPVEEVVAWKNDRFEFNGDLKSIMRQIERWYDVEVIYENPAVEQLSFSAAVSRKKYVSEVLKKLEMTGSVHFKIEGRKVIVAD